jgi:hypothetical protein
MQFTLWVHLLGHSHVSIQMKKGKATERGRRKVTGLTSESSTVAGPLR